MLLCYIPQNLCFICYVAMLHTRGLYFICSVTTKPLLHLLCCYVTHHKTFTSSAMLLCYIPEHFTSSAMLPQNLCFICYVAMLHTTKLLLHLLCCYVTHHKTFASSATLLCYTPQNVYCICYVAMLHTTKPLPVATLACSTYPTNGYFLTVFTFYDALLTGIYDLYQWLCTTVSCTPDDGC
jgi:hypothetical protein